MVAVSASFDALSAVRKGWQLFRNRELLSLVVLAVFVSSMFDIISVISSRTMETHPAATGLIVLGAMAIFIISQMYFWPKILHAAMNLAGVVVKKPAPGVLDWLIFTARMVVVNFFCLYDKRLLIPAFAFIAAGFVLAPIAVLKDSNSMFDAAALIAGIGLMAWLVAIFIHCIRTCFASFIFVRGDGNAAYSIRTSFDRTRGRMVEIFLALIVIGIFVIPLPLAIGFISTGIEEAAASFGWVEWAGPIAGIVVTYPLAVIYGALLPVVMSQLFGFFDKKLGFAKKTKTAN